MRIAFFDTKPYDHIWFDREAGRHGYEIKYFDYRLNADTAPLAAGFDAACIFVNDEADAEVIDILHRGGTRLLALRCAGYNNVNCKAASGRLRIVRVPEYSPAAVAEHAAALLLSINRKTHRAYTRTRDNNFSINGLMGFDLMGKTAGIVGCGKIGRAFIRICMGFGMNVIAYDPCPAEIPGVRFVQLDELFREADVISLHCPLTPQTEHMIGEKTLSVMKPHTLIINTSRGALIDTTALIEALKAQKLGGAGLDVYEEESDFFFEDFSGRIVDDDELARLLSFPNVIVTSHQAFFTEEAMRAIAAVTIENIRAFEAGEALANEILPAKRE